MTVTPGWYRLVVCEHLQSQMRALTLVGYLHDRSSEQAAMWLCETCAAAYRLTQRSAER